MTALFLSGLHIDNPNERLAVSLTVALIAHLILVFGVSFTLTKPAPLSNTLDIVLVQSETREAPEKANYLAQANQEGGGESDANRRPSSLVRAPFPDDKAQLVSSVAPPELAAKQQAPQLETLSSRQAAQEQIETQKHIERRDAESQQGEQKRNLVPNDAVAMLSLIQNAKTALASAQSVIDQAEAQSQRPRHAFPRANAKQDIYAAYMDSWRIKTESIGNRHYPQSAREQGIFGEVVLDVAVNHDGTIYELKVLRSSGHSLLDNAAKRTARDAAPYAPFPKEVRREADILHIIRTWRYSNETLHTLAAPTEAYE